MFRSALVAVLATGLTATALPAQESSGSSSGGDAGQAQSSQSVESGQSDAPQNVITAAMLENASVVSLEGEYNEAVWQDEAPLSTMLADLTEIGQVQDVVLSARGEVQGVTVDVGGFLGIGSKAVLIPLDDIRLARPDPEAEELTVVTRLNEQQLQELQEFEMED